MRKVEDKRISFKQSTSGEQYGESHVYTILYRENIFLKHLMQDLKGASSFISLKILLLMLLMLFYVYGIGFCLIF